MSFRKLILSTAGAIVLVGGVAVSSSAQNTDAAPKAEGKTYNKAEKRGGKRGGKGMRGGFGGLRGIELSEEQKVTIKAIRDANRPNEAVREEMRSIMQARRAGTITPEQTQRAQQLREQARQNHEIVRTQIEAILTPEQRQQLEIKKQEMRQRMEQRRGQFEQRRQERELKKDTVEKPID